MHCILCTNENLELIKLKEVFYGTLESFDYYLCKNCNFLQIANVPKNLDSFYPKNYHSKTEIKKNLSFNYFIIQRDKYLLFHRNFFGKFIHKIKKGNELLNLLSIVNITMSDRILDIGCGNAYLLKLLSRIGFNNLEGIDPNINSSYKYGNVFIKKSEYSQIRGKYDLLILNHVLEHLPDQKLIFEIMHRILNENGRIMLRTPNLNSYAWNEYNTNWIQLDPPRHLYIHSLKSLEIICNEYGFNIEKIIYDSNSFQFWGSELVKKGIPLAKIKQEDSLNYYFDEEQMKNYNKKSNELNIIGKGDQFAIFLSKKNN